MNYKQKQRIEQLTESTLIIGADIAKSFVKSGIASDWAHPHQPYNVIYSNLFL
ncbi:hypothetical protein [Desulfotomaculum sp. 1211_IL3151]|uniref:hypothetical protein n=1 Tax=Desulfotomaculum sp. 1211_IL3151 TaxID=3084055 RepID=UPI002FDA7822